MFDIASDSHNWDSFSLQEPHIDHNLIDFDEFRESVSRPETLACPDATAVGSLPAVPPVPRGAQRPNPIGTSRAVIWCIPARAASLPQLRYTRVIVQTSDGSGLASMPPAHWWGANYVILSAYLPHPGHGFTLYQEALANLTCFIRSAPRRFGSFQIVPGCGANAQLVQRGSIPGAVGPRYSPSSADSERSRELLGFMLAHELVAVNTFDGGPGIVGEASAPDAKWTHMWYKDKDVLSQIDFILASASLESHCRVDYSFDCCTDHKPIMGSFMHRLPHSRTSRRRCCKGFAPKDPTEFCSAIRKFSSKASVGEIQKGLTDAMSSIVCVAPPCPRRSAPTEPEHVKEARRELAACSDPVDRHTWSKMLYRRKRKWLRWHGKPRGVSEMTRSFSLAPTNCPPGRFRG